MSTEHLYNESHLNGSIQKEIEALRELLKQDINLHERVWVSSRISQLRLYGKIGPSDNKESYDGSDIGMQN